jgi:sialate O-acetylesterase
MFGKELMTAYSTMKMQIRTSLLIVTILLFSQTLASAQITLPKVFGDSMVLQRGIKIPVWGNSTPGALIVAKLGDVEATTRANKEGKWQLKFPIFKAGGPYELEVAEAGKTSSKIILKGILIGDVWVASGQSNMEWQVQQAKDARKEIANANYPKIRFLVVEQDKQLKPQTDIRGGKWKDCDSTNVKGWSAVAYYFARKIQRDQNVPVGIIQSTWGGTPIEAWTSREMLLTSPITKSRTLSNDTLSLDREDFVADSLSWIRIWDIVYNPQNNADKIFPTPTFDDAGWKTVEMPSVIKDFGIGNYEGMVWLRKKLSLPESFAGKDITLNLGHPEMNYSLYFNGQEICKNVWYSNPTHSYTIPASLVKSGENTIAVRIAMLWGGGGLSPVDDICITDGSSKISLVDKWLYQKDLETAFPKILNYQYYPTVLFNAMINPLIPYGVKGFIWYQGESNAQAAYNYRKLFPMLIKDWRQRWQQGNLPFLFVQLANYMKTKPLPSESEWAELREAQTLSLSQPNTGMACIIDIGEATDVHPKNKQEVGRRLALIANKMVYKQECIASGPVYKNYRVEGNRIRIIFASIGSGLSTKEGKDVRGFAIAGKDQQFYWAKAIVKGNEGVVYSDQVAEPVAVRYAWADNPECNLVNSEGLPAVPFRTDDWRGITEK